MVEKTPPPVCSNASAGVFLCGTKKVNFLKKDVDKMGLVGYNNKALFKCTK